MGGRDAGSTMICTSARVEVGDTSATRLRQPRWSPRRGIASLQARVGGQPIGVVGLHLSLLAHSRPTELARVLATAGGLSGAVVVAGDVNEPPRGPAWAQAREAGWRDPSPGEHQQTFPAAKPRVRIDAIWLRAEAGGHDPRVVRHEVIRDLRGEPGLVARASDHCPVIMDLAWPGRQGS